MTFDLKGLPSLRQPDGTQLQVTGFGLEVLSKDENDPLEVSPEPEDQS